MHVVLIGSGLTNSVAALVAYGRSKNDFLYFPLFLQLGLDPNRRRRQGPVRTRPSAVFSSGARDPEGHEGVLLRLGHCKPTGEHPYDSRDVRGRSKTFVWSLTRISLILKLENAFMF